MRTSNKASLLKQKVRTFWVAVSSDAERSQLIEEVIRTLDPNAANLRRLSGELDFSALSDHLQTPSIFGDEPIAWVEDAEKIVKADFAKLEGLLPKDFGYLIFGARTKSNFSDVVDRCGAVLDLLAEKPWEREKRLGQWVESALHSRGKSISPQGLERLLECCNGDAGLLERETEKLVCYAGDRTRIGAEDVLAICPADRSYAVWQAAEEVVWEGTGDLQVEFFHPLIPALRSQLALGLKIATLLSQNATREEWSESFPKIFPKTLEKRTSDVQRRSLGARYFSRALIALFEMELHSRTGSQQLDALLDLFRCKLQSFR